MSFQTAACLFAFPTNPARLRAALWSRLCVALFVGLACAADVCHLQAESIDPGDFVLQYRPADGNLTLLFTGTGAAGVGPISLQELNIITLGNTDAGNPAMPSGIPNVTAGQGGLNGVRATLPTAAFQTFNTGSNSDGLNGIYSQIYNANVGSTWITFTKTTPGVTDTLNLGNVAATGWSQSNINTIFMTDPDLYDGNRNLGHFGYTLGDGSTRIGSVVAPVPEPGTLALLGAGGLALAVRFVRGRRSAPRSVA